MITMSVCYRLSLICLVCLSVSLVCRLSLTCLSLSSVCLSVSLFHLSVCLSLSPVHPLPVCLTRLFNKLYFHDVTSVTGHVEFEPELIYFVPFHCKIIIIINNNNINNSF